MKNNFLVLIILTILFSSGVFASQFVPEFDKMKYLRCEIDETIYNQDNTVVSNSHYHRFYRLDDEYKQIYLQKEPVDMLIYYDTDKIQFHQQEMTDDFIEQTEVTLDRTSMKYFSNSRINYDNPDFGIRYSKGEGVCKILN